MRNLKEQIVHEIHKPARKNYPRRHVIVKFIDDLWQADLVELIAYEKENQHYRYLLTVIDSIAALTALPVFSFTGIAKANLYKMLISVRVRAFR